MFLNSTAFSYFSNILNLTQSHDMKNYLPLLYQTKLIERIMMKVILCLFQEVLKLQSASMCNMYKYNFSCNM